MKSFIFALSILVSLSAYAIPDYPWRETSMEQRVRATWDEKYFTDPAQHNPSQFLYMVHKLNLKNPEFTEDLLKDPQSLENKFRICTSVISQDFMGLYKGSIGLILKAPAVNVGPMHSQDMSSRFAPTYDGAIKQFRLLKLRFKNLYTPSSLILATQNSGVRSNYNEVNILGTNLSTNTHIQVLGILIECGDRRSPHKKSALLRPEDTAAVIERCVEEPNYKDLLKTQIGKYPFLMFDD